MERVRPEGSGRDRGEAFGGSWSGICGGSAGPGVTPPSPPQRFSLEQRTERLVQRSQALLGPRPRGPERAKPPLGSAPCSSTLDDPLERWRLRRCRGEETALDTPLGAPPGGKRGSHEPLRQEPIWGSHDCLGHLQCVPWWESRDSQGAPRSAPEALPEPLRRGGPGFRSRDRCEAPQPIRSSAHDALQEAPLQEPLGPLGDPLLWMLRCHRRAISGRLRAIETLLECPPGHPQPMYRGALWNAFRIGTAFPVMPRGP
ncbi:uncharacterized protein LOC131590197 isoform X13 [Poecile atricapillus]|uniref:uncharacterized protein LOC131590197 isoform X13 n=1 Tax=Poecile atricapillus TaxID=48891 RepID=UPI002739943A|nr:uncharacterized protein LOC131590197 isoform X13 [Poecile atricapillus]